VPRVSAQGYPNPMLGWLGSHWGANAGYLGHGYLVSTAGLGLPGLGQSRYSASSSCRGVTVFSDLLIHCLVFITRLGVNLVVVPPARYPTQPPYTRRHSLLSCRMRCA
jgi:hypothetical protein